MPVAPCNPSSKTVVVSNSHSPMDHSQMFHENGLPSDQNHHLHDDDDDDDGDETGDDGDDGDEELPTALTDVNLRCKLIYIYNCFRTRSTEALHIFVRFFKRHHLIDSSALAMNNSTDNMFTYDLFSLSPSHIGELANDLGYVAPSTA